MKGDAFSFQVISFDHIKKEYTLKNIKTGRVKIISKEDYDYYVSEGNKKDKKQVN
jgi:hypothetical protein